MAGEKFTTSFIPKKPVQTTAPGGRIRKKRGGNIWMVLSFFVFLVACVLTVGVFLYTIKLENDVEKQEANLAKAAESLEERFISEVVRLNDRLIGVNALLSEHLSPSQIFYFLEERTIASVRFSDLSFSFNNDGDIILNGSGVATGFEAIIQQSDEYGRGGYLRDVIFSNLQNNQNGLVSFSFDGKINPEIILYSNVLPDTDNTFQQNSGSDDDMTDDQNATSTNNTQSSGDDQIPAGDPSGMQTDSNNNSTTI